MCKRVSISLHNHALTAKTSVAEHANNLSSLWLIPSHTINPSVAVLLPTQQHWCLNSLCYCSKRPVSQPCHWTRTLWSWKSIYCFRQWLRKIKGNVYVPFSLVRFTNSDRNHGRWANILFHNIKRHTDWITCFHVMQWNIFPDSKCCFVFFSLSEFPVLQMLFPHYNSTVFCDFKTTVNVGY